MVSATECIFLSRSSKEKCYVNIERLSCDFFMIYNNVAYESECLASTDLVDTYSPSTKLLLKVELINTMTGIPRYSGRCR